MTLQACAGNLDADPSSATKPEIVNGSGKVLFVILNFNGIADTLVCLDSLAAQTCQNFTVLVIDNGSRADDLSPVLERHPTVELLALPDNLGWAGGNNVGLRLAIARRYDHVCLLNNDTVLDPAMLEEMLAAVERIGHPCLLHPAIAFFDEPQCWQLYPELRPSDASARALADQHDIAEMDHAYGACLLVPGSALRQVGLFDERLFLQFEEYDYYQRAIRLGLRSYCARRARILHRESASFGGRVTEAKVYYQVRNRLLMAEKHTPSPRGYWQAARVMLWGLYQQAHTVDATIDGWPKFLRWLLASHPYAAAARQGVRDYLHRRFGCRSSAVA